MLKEGFELAKKSPLDADAADKLKTVQNEVQKLLDKVGRDKLAVANKITPTAINEEVLNQTLEFLDIYRNYSLQKQQAAISKKDIITSSLIDDGTYDELKTNHRNDVVAQTVTNGGSLKRIVNKRNELHRLSDPIYDIHYKPGNIFDYRAPLYVPIKHFLGATLPTTYFNILVIWFMTGLLALTLYNDGLKKLSKIFDKKP